MQKWEYLVVEANLASMTIRLQPMQRQLDEYGQAGWELVALETNGGKGVAVLKRPKG
jgi:hypothetical protein